MEELVLILVVIGMAGKELDIREDVMIVYNLNQSMSQQHSLKVEQFANVHYSQMHSVMNNELVEQHRKHPKKLDIEDQLMNNMLDHCQILEEY